MKDLYTIPFLIFFIFSYSTSTKAQDSLRIYFNVGFVTSIVQPPGRLSPDSGGSVRVGLFTKSRFGPYIGYVWFKEDETGEYYDKGSLFIGGIDYRLLRRGDFEMYAKAGLIIEKYISVYSDREDTEISPKPDFGLLINVSKFNAYAGWQPSDPSHFNLGVGFTF